MAVGEENRHFVVRVDGFAEAFVVAPSHSKAKAKVARSLRDSNYAYDFWDGLCMIRSCRLTKESIGSVYTDYHAFQ